MPIKGATRLVLILKVLVNQLLILGNIVVILASLALNDVIL